DLIPLIWISAVERDERFIDIAVSDDDPRSEHELRHVLQMPHRNELLEPVDFAQRDRERQYHRKSGINCARDKIRRKDGRMPAWDYRDSEIETDDGVNRDNKWSCQPRQQQISLFIPLPVIGGAAPAHRHHSIDNLCEPVFGSVAKRSKIRNQTDVPEHQRKREI